MHLHYKVYGEGNPLLILHGFMGSLDNWHTLASQFGKTHKVYAIDQRNHGKSGHSNNHTLALMVSDVKLFIETHELNKVSIIGHSMGGKVAMQFALDYPDLVDKLIVVDIAPKQYKRGHDDVFKAIFSVELNKIESRKHAEQMMEPHVPDFGTRQFLLKNLDRKEDGSYAWKMNLQTLHADYDEIIKAIISNGVFNGDTLVIKGANSRYINYEDELDFNKLFPKNEIVVIPQAGHWVHAEAPQLFFETVNNFLN
ncbi:MAG: alpha/beta fold hydrolase [Bacteroidia bacterium]|nr:alpha/beta fold hydrolase [Bacteroidia bacterium]